MRTDDDLRERFDRATTSLPIPPGDVAAVVARARQRARRQRVAGAAAGVAAVVGAAVLVPRVVMPAERLTVDPVDAPTAPATPPPSPAATTDATATLAEDHLRYGIDGVHRQGREPRMLSSLSAQRAVGLPDGGAVIQSGTGGALVRLGPDGAETELLPGTPGLRFLTVHDGHAWATVRETPDAGEDEERLRSMPLDGGDVVDHGSSAGYESFTDALAFLPDGRAAWLTCHLQCALVLGDGHPATSPDRQRLTDRAGWYAGLATDATGRRLALVEGPDPVVGGTSDVVVLDVDGRELARTPLPAGLALDTAHVDFTADGDDLVAGDEAHAFVIRGWASDDPTVGRLEGDAGVALVPTAPAPRPGAPRPTTSTPPTSPAPSPRSSSAGTVWSSASPSTTAASPR